MLAAVLLEPIIQYRAHPDSINARHHFQLKNLRAQNLQNLKSVNLKFI